MIGDSILIILKSTVFFSKRVISDILLCLQTSIPVGFPTCLHHRTKRDEISASGFSAL